MTIVYNNPLVIGSGICKDVVAPLCLDKRLPLDTLFMVFEEDYRFFSEGRIQTAATIMASVSSR